MFMIPISRQPGSSPLGLAPVWLDAYFENTYPLVSEAAELSVFYVQDVIGAEYTYITELRDDGKHGFVIPEKEILPTSVECFEGIRHMLDHMK